MPDGDRRERELAARRRRARQEEMTVQLLARAGGDGGGRGDGDGSGFYAVTGRSGRLYRVELRASGADRCECVDFRRNGLGTCKHIEAVRLQLQGEGGEDRASCATDAAGAPCVPDVVFFDLETQRLFQEVGGPRHVSRLGLALACAYSTRDRTFSSFTEAEAEALIHQLCAADLVIGFNIIRFDYAVLQPYSLVDLQSIPSLDLLAEVHRSLGFRVSLDSLARATLGHTKTADGLQSVAWFREGRLDLVEEYCRQDVAITRELFEFGLRHDCLKYVDRHTGQVARVPVDWSRGEARRLYLAATA